MSKIQRIKVVDALKQHFSSKEAKQIEKVIHDTCKRLCQDHGEELEESYLRYAFEKIGIILSSPVTDEVIEDIKEGHLGWESCIYDEIRKKIALANSEYTEKMQVEEGEFPCRNRECKSKKCYYWQTQDRSGDEGASTHVLCTVCGTKYKFN